MDFGGNIATAAPGPLLASLLLAGRPAARVVCGAAAAPSVYPNPFCAAEAIPLAGVAASAAAASAGDSSGSAVGVAAVGSDNSGAATATAAAPTASALVVNGIAVFTNLQVG